MRADAEFCATALAGEPGVRRVALPPARRSSWFFPATAAAAAVLLLALFLTPLGTYASAFLTIFQPREFVPLDLTHAQLHELRIAPQAMEFGATREVRKPHRVYYAQLGAARQHVAFDAKSPTVLPPGFGTVHSFWTVSPGEWTFTFSAAKARAYAAKHHKRLPAIPPELNGTVVRVKSDQALEMHYEASGHSGRPFHGPFLEIVQSPVPTVTSSGASFAQLETYLLRLPGIAPDLAAQIRALGDLRDRVPVPVDVSRATGRRIEIDGVQGVAVGDNTGLGAGVVWQRNGTLYTVAGGALTMDQVLAVARGLR